MKARYLAAGTACFCLLSGSAAIASYYLGSTAERPIHLFALSAQQFDPRPSWPPRQHPVAFNGEMVALLTMGASVSAAARNAIRIPAAEPAPRPMTRRERRQAQREERARRRAEAYQARAQAAESDDGVEVRVYDRRGRTVRSRRVHREPSRRLPPFGTFGRW